MSAEDKPMFPFNDTSVMRHPAKASQRASTKIEVPLPNLARQVPAILTLLPGMVVSSEDGARRRLTESQGQCGWTQILASTLPGTHKALANSKCSLVSCHESLA